MKNYRTLIDNCKNYFNNGDMKNAWKCWCEINDLFLDNLDKYDTHEEEERKKVYSEYYYYMEEFANEEIYKITDYGKELYYIEEGYREI